MLFEGNLKIMDRNILLKFFGRTIYNKELHLRRYEKNGRIANNCQSIFDADPYFLS
jgi:hypothetical protein